MSAGRLIPFLGLALGLLLAITGRSATRADGAPAIAPVQAVAACRPADLGVAAAAPPAGRSGAATACMVEATCAGARLRCEPQDLVAEADGTGLRIASLSRVADGAACRIELVSLRHGDGPLQDLAGGPVLVDGPLTSRRRGTVVEEYRAGDAGVRHDIVLAESAPPPIRAGVACGLRVDGARVRAGDASGVLLDLADGRVLTYDRLLVTDAAGATVPARMVPDGAHGISIEVDDRAAAYPIRIDPTISDANWISMGVPAGATGNVQAMTWLGTDLIVGGTFTSIGTTETAYVARWDGSLWAPLGQGMDGPVAALATSGTTLYAGGSFQHAGGVTARGVASWNGVAWAPVGTWTLGQVTSLAVDGSTVYAGDTSGNVARWNGVSWTVLGGPMDGRVSALAMVGTTLYAGGQFTTAAGIPAAHLAQWDGSVWSPVGTGTNNDVYALVATGSTLHLGGTFTTAGGLTATGVASWDGSSWSALGAGAGPVSALTASGTSLYAGTLAGGIVRWDGTTWATLGTASSGTAALAASGTTLYVGGSFIAINGVVATSLAKWDGSQWSSMAVGTGLNGVVNALASSGTGLYVGGMFNTAGNLRVNGIVRWDDGVWYPLGTGLNSFGSINALAVTGSTLYAGGSFFGVGGISANRIARWNGSVWAPLGTGLNGTVNALAVAGTALYAGGNFTTADGNSANYIARWDGDSWEPLGSGMNGSVYALAISGTKLYAGGQFTSAGGVAVSNIAQWDGSAWAPLGAGTNNQVLTLAVADAVLYAGGLFNQAGGVSARSIARWDGDAWSPLGTGISSGSVLALAVTGSTLYAGGSFVSVGGIAARNVAQWDGAAWSALGSGTNSSPRALAASTSALTVGGSFTRAGNALSVCMARCLIAPPRVETIVPLSSSSVGSGQFRVRFSDAVSGVSPANFSLANGTGLTGTAVITGVSGAGATYTVSVDISGLGGAGYLTLELSSGVGIVNAAGDGLVGTASGALLYPPAPAITGLTPGSGPLAGGTTVSITGANLVGTSGVTFAGAAATAVTVTSPTSVTCVTPAGSGMAEVVLTTPYGAVTAPGGYVYQGSPAIAGITPPSGSTAGGMRVTITGTNLMATGSVTFGGTPATAVTVVDASTVTCVTPAKASGSVDVVLTTPSGSATASGAYAFRVPFTLVINSGNAGVSQPDQFLLPLDGVSAYDFTVDWGDGASSVVSDATSPLHTYASAGTYTVRITENVVGGFPAIRFDNGGDRLKLLRISNWGAVTWASMRHAFMGCANLVITATDHATAQTQGVSDFSGAWQGCSALTSFPLLATGGGSDFSHAWSGCSGLSIFPALDLADMVDGTGCFDGVTLATPTYSALLIGLAASNLNTAVTFSGGDSHYGTSAIVPRDTTLIGGRGWVISDGGALPPPSLLSISPVCGLPAGGMTVTLTGTHLAEASAVTFGGTPATAVTVLDANTVTCVVPARSAGAAAVVLTTPGGTANGVFTYQNAPSISSLTPRVDQVTGGLTVTINGANLLGTSSVSFGGAAATAVTVISASQVTCVTPARAPGRVGVQLTTPCGSVTTLVNSNRSFTYQFPNWTMTQAMAQQRRHHTATLLTSGEVLVAGGEDGGGALSVCELYQPITGSWSATGGQLAQARYGHTATMLSSGKILVAGGRNGSSHLASCELYDPATGTWSPTNAPMAAARAFATATLLPSGRVLVAGGDDGAAPLTSCEVYDPATGTWSPTSGHLATARSHHTSTLLPTGRVLTAGGWNGSAVADCEVFDPGTGTWSPTTAPLGIARQDHTATLLATGQVLVAGGAGPGALAGSELFDPGSGTWSATGPLAQARSGHAATLLPSGRVLVIGGEDGSPLAGSELYDPVAGTWNTPPGPSMTDGRSGPTATLLPSGRVLVVGGDGSVGPLATCGLHDPTQGADSWTATDYLSTRTGHTATLLPSGQVLVTGGTTDGATYLTSCELYDPATGQWTATGSMLRGRDSHSATLLASGLVLVVGGQGYGTTPNSELYDPDTGTWSACSGSMGVHRYFHTATLLPSGKVLVTGGSGGLAGYQSSCELYDPGTDAWSPTGAMSWVRVYHTTTLLPGGKVLAIGGVNVLNGDGQPSCELYDPVAGTWSPTATPMAQGRLSHSASVLPSGRVLVAGGWSGWVTNTVRNECEYYDPATGTWHAAAAMATARSNHTASLLPSGGILVTGGYFSSSSEIYYFDTETWRTTTCVMPFGAYGHQAVLLPSGRVLVAGGQDGAGFVTGNSALYDPGLGIAPASRPVISTCPTVVPLEARLIIQGTGFTGIAEGSSGGSASSPANHPLVQIVSEVNEQSAYLPCDPGVGFSATAVTTQPVPSLPLGPARVRVVVNGIASASVPITLAQGDPTLVWPTPAAITYGTALSASQLNATASVPGTCTYAPASGTILPIGDAQTLSVTFVPSDQVSYRTVTANVLLTVNKLPQTITCTAPGDQILGVAPLTLQASATSGLAPTFSVLSGPATLAGDQLTLTAVGTVVVAADQAGDAMYAAAPRVMISILVTSPGGQAPGGGAGGGGGGCGIGGMAVILAGTLLLRLRRRR